MDGTQLRNVLDRISDSYADVARKLNISTQHLNKLMQTPDIKSGWIEKIAAAYQLPVSAMYADPENISRDRISGSAYVIKSYAGRDINCGTDQNFEVEILKERIAGLEALLEEKERLIKVLTSEK